MRLRPGEMCIQYQDTQMNGGSYLKRWILGGRSDQLDPSFLNIRQKNILSSQV